MNDLFIRRAYTHKGVSVVVDIDLVKKTATLADKNGQRKQWLFADRELGYMQGWQNILSAMSYAIAEASKVLQEAEDRNIEEFAKLLHQIDNKSLKGKQ